MKRILRVLLVLLAIGSVICLVLWWRFVIVHVSQETGTTSGSSRSYQFWSGFGANFGEIAVIGGLVTLVRHHNCHVKGCWRLGKHEVDGTPYKVCAIHHPTIPAGEVTEAHIKEAHDKRTEDAPARRVTIEPPPKPVKRVAKKAPPKKATRV
jgi:hypothetical protein